MRHPMVSSVRSDQEAWDLVLQHKRDIERLVLRYRWNPTSTCRTTNDFIQDAMLASFRAAQTWDESRGMKFVSWAAMRIRAEIMPRLRDRGLTATDRGLHVTSMSSLDKERLCSDGATRSWYDFMPASEMPVDEQFLLAERDSIVRQVIEHLGRRSRQVIERYLTGQSGAEVGKKMGFSRQRVSQIEIQAKARLREQLADVAG